MKVLLILTTISKATLYEKMFKNDLSDFDYVFYIDYQLSEYDYKLDEQIKNEFDLQ